jgi:hypothetical protein
MPPSEERAPDADWWPIPWGGTNHNGVVAPQLRGDCAASIVVRGYVLYVERAVRNNDRGRIGYTVEDRDRSAVYAHRLPIRVYLREARSFSSEAELRMFLLQLAYPEGS